MFDHLQAHESGEPGVVVALEGGGVVVATANGAIRISKLRADGGNITASECAASTRLKAGGRLGD